MARFHASAASARRRVTGSLVSILVLVGLPGAALAFSYVALGDSIAAGVGDTSGGYVARYADDVATDLAVGVSLQNLAVSGSTSGDLLASLTGDSGVQAAVSGAD